MTCACRETCNIFKNPRPLMYKFHWNKRKRKWYSWRLIYEDTIMPVICKLKGHIPYLVGEEQGDPNYNEIACKRCHRFI